MEQLYLTDNIIELNRDMEPFIVQGSASRPVPFKDRYVPLQFVHFTDAHDKLKPWNRMVEYINHYEKYIAFALHTGDYCGSSQLKYTDFYNDGIPCKKVIYNCVGNHDTEVNEDWTKGKPCRSTKEGVYKLLFNRIEDWDVKFMPGDFSMTYYKDFLESNVRLVVLDYYYDIEEQKKWLKAVLNDAREGGLHVITAAHDITDFICSPEDTPFHTANDYALICGEEKRSPFESIIESFILSGGVHVIHLAGHTHHDRFGHTKAGILNCTVECATFWNGWCDGNRVAGTRTYDAFNVVSVDVNVGVITLARIGDNVDHYLRRKQSLCFDYINKKLIYT